MKYLFLSSTDSLDLSPNNSTYDFTVTLPQTIMGEFKIALVEMHYTSHFEDLYVYCDIAEQSYVKDSSLPILRIVSQMGEFGNLYFFPVTRRAIQRIRVYITNKDFETPLQDAGPIRCTLVLQPR